MPAEPPPFLTYERLRSMPATGILVELKTWLARVNPISLLHPHGFHVVLLSRTEGEEWRFHLWPQGPRVVAGMPAFIHTHDRHVDSWILQGRLKNIMYAVSTVSAGGRPLYEVGYAGDRYQASTSNALRRTELRVRTDVLSEATMEPGDTYRVNHHDYHEAIVPEDCCTATLVRMSDRAPGAVRVIGLDGYPEEFAFRRAEVRAEAFVGSLAPQRLGERSNERRRSGKPGE